MFWVSPYFFFIKGIEGSTAMGVTQVATTSIGMCDIDIRPVSIKNKLNCADSLFTVQYMLRLSF